MTSHAAVVARGMGKCCVAGAGSINVDYAKQQMSVNADGKLVVVKRGDVLTLDGATGEVILGRRAHVGRPRSTSDFGDAHALGRRAPARCACAPTPTRRTTRRPRATSAPRASASAAPSTCSSSEDRILAVREMILADDVAERAARARQAPAHAARATSSASSARWTGCRSPSACSIRRCTSSCPPRTSRSRSSPRRCGVTPDEVRARVDGAARVQPDARPPRLPPRHHLPRDLRDAGARDPRGRAARCGARASTCSPRS